MSSSLKESSQMISWAQSFCATLVHLAFLAYKSSVVSKADRNFICEFVIDIFYRKINKLRQTQSTLKNEFLESRTLCDLCYSVRAGLWVKPGCLVGTCGRWRNKTNEK